MANPIRRLLQIVLDKSAAARAEREAKKALSGIGEAMGGLRSLAVRVGAAITAALGVRALINFGREAVRQAIEGEKAWSSLAGTIQNAGGNFRALEGDLRALSTAFRDATIHGGDDYAQTLDRLITLTGDVTASTNNMGLVANVAAQFFNGELAPAAELVAKVMNGQTSALQRMGIQVKSAQEGLDVLAKRSFGAAERQAGTFGGQVTKLNNLWSDFKQELGEVLITSDGTTGALDVLSGAVRSMIQWVSDNKDALREWVTNGVNFAINAMQTLLGLVKTFAQARGNLPLTMGTPGAPLAATPEGLKRQLAGFERQRKQAVQEQAGALKALEDFQRGVFGTGFRLFGQANPRLLQLNSDLQAANDLLEQIDANAEAARQKLALLQAGGGGSGAPSLFGGTPRTGKNLVGEGTKADDVDSTEERFKRLSEAIARAREQALRYAQADLKKELRETVFAFEDGEEAARNMALALAGDVNQSLDPVGTRLSMLQDEAFRLTFTMQRLAELGMKNSDPIMQSYANRLKEIHAVIQETTKAQQFGAEVAGAFGEAIGAAMGAGIGPFALSKARQNLIEAAELGVRAIVAALNPFTAPQAAVLSAAAAKHLAIAGAWSALAGASAVGGFAGGGGGGSLASARGASGSASRAASPAQEITIVLAGPGFHALNPSVQRVVYGAYQQARERYGDNTVIRVSRSP